MGMQILPAGPNLQPQRKNSIPGGLLIFSLGFGGDWGKVYCRFVSMFVHSGGVLSWDLN